jgi:hypothetical protein
VPNVTPGRAVPSADRAWFIYKYLNPVSAEDPRTAFTAGFHRAYRDSISDQVDFAGLLPLLQRLLDLLEELRVERDVVRSIADGEVEI